jgi:hypothetical protein
MASMFDKLNLEEEREILVLNPPAAFAAELCPATKIYTVTQLGLSY